MKRPLILTAILAALVGLAFLVARPHVPDPSASVVRARAAQLLAELEAAGPAPPCDVGPPASITFSPW